MQPEHKPVNSDIELGNVEATIENVTPSTITPSVTQQRSLQRRETKCPSMSCPSGSSKLLSLAGVGLFSSAIVGGIGAGSSALCGLVGSEILKASDYDQYDTDSVVKSAAAGGAILFSVYGAVRFMLQSCCASNSEGSEPNQIGQLILSTGFAALSSVIGAAVLHSDEMSTKEYAAATAVGAAVFGGAGAALNALCR